MNLAQGDSTCCGISANVEPIIYKFKQGSIVYSIKKAKKGIIESIAIKNVKINSAIIYTDSFNGLWNESELCLEATAKAIAIAYLQEQQQLIIDTLGKCL